MPTGDKLSVRQDSSDNGIIKSRSRDNPRRAPSHQNKSQQSRDQRQNVMHDGGEAYDYDNSDRGGPNFNGDPNQRNAGEQDLNNGQARGEGPKSAGPSQMARQRTRKEKMNIKRYESNSIDEEEFQDYFTNPIKRKEFDRQRKKQQMREMQNITGFTLGQFGIKSMKAMKEAMPAYPDDDDIPNQNDQQKNYATVSLCCLSVTNPFRNKIIQLVAVNPWFDRFILFVIMVNCCFLALDKEVDSITENSETIDFVFLLIYTMEMILKIIAMGFFMRAHSYLRDSWNILDFMVVMLGWLSSIIKSGDISAIKVIRILRPLRTINQIPNMSSLVSTILNSLPIMFDVMVLFFFMLIMFGTIATQLLGGHLDKRCTKTFPDGMKTIFLGTEQVEIICNYDLDCHSDYHEITGYTQEMKDLLKCEYYGNPISKTYSFDNILLSIMNIFQIITLEGWTDMMYIVRDGERSKVFDAFFVSCVVFGSFVILNLMIAVQASYLDKAFDEEDNRQKELQEKIEMKKRLKMERDEMEEYDEEEDVFDDDQEKEGSDPEETGRRRSSRKKKESSKSGCCDFQKPKWYINLSEWCLKICESKSFEQGIIILICINTLFLASEHYDPPAWLVKLSEIANLFFTVIFLLEMLMKICGFGCKKYLEDNFNIFDAFIVTMSYVELVMPAGSSSSLSVLRAFRLLRVFKIIKSWDSLRILLSTVLDSLTAITNLGVLIVLFLFIAALLTKQFYSEDLYESDRVTVSRYSFGSTGQALVTMFIILTGENWNEIMIQVIDKFNTFAPAVFFIIMMIIGNFMLLNLFLAILLKSISEIGNSDDEEETKADGSAQEADAAPQINKEEADNDSVPLNSSNSNIEEEFEQIKLQLMALSNNMNALDGSIKNGIADNEEDEFESQSMSMDSDMKKQQLEAKKKREESRAQQAKINKMSQNQALASASQPDESEEHKGYSLFIFAHDNCLRVALREFVSNSYFAGFIYHMIALNSLLLALDQPQLEDPYQRSTIAQILLIISLIFVAEFVIKIIVCGFYWGGEKTYLKDAWNILDFIIVCFSFLTWILEAIAGDTNISFIRGFRALRALRPLRVVSKNEGIKTVVNSLILSIPALMNVLLIVLLFLMVFGILGIQLFKGKLGNCNDLNDGLVKNKKECTGFFHSEIYDFNGETIGLERTKREWEVNINNYDHIFNSMLTFFEISTLEMWPGMMYAAIDGVGIDQVPEEKANEWVASIFVIFIFFTTFFIMNLFISVIVDKFNEEIKKRQGSDNFTDEQKEWVKIQRLLVHTNPKIIPVEPINCFRLQCFKIVQSQAFEYVVMTAIVINTFFLCIDYYGKPAKLEQVLDRANLSFVIFFTLEMSLKITAYGFKYYWYVNWNKFDFIIVMMSLIAFDEELLEKLNFNPTALRIIRVSRLLRMVKTSEGLRTLLKTLFMSLGNILNTAALLMLIFFTFSVAGMGLFGVVPDGDFIDKNVNFRSFYIAMMTLWRASTGESWNGIMHECTISEGFISVCFWLLFQLIAFFIFMNVFIAVIGESFNDNQATEDENDILALKKKDIKAFQNTWAKYNPMGELYMRTIRLPDFLRELPPPLGYQGIRIEESKLNKIIFCLNIRDHLGRVYYPEVMWTIFHSIAGMNDDKVLNCEQITNILKIVKGKYKGLGKKVNLDSLCGNKYYRKELTAIKYIQAMKILTKWRNFKNIKAKNREQGIGGNIQAANITPQKQDEDQRPAQQRGQQIDNKLFQESQNEQPATNQNYARANNNQPEFSDHLEPYENNSGGYGSEVENNNQQRQRDQRVQGINQQINANRQRDREMSDNAREPSRGAHSRGGNSRRGGPGRAQNYQENPYEENDNNYEPSQNQRSGRNGGRNQQRDDNFDGINASMDSADRDNQVTERNPTSNRNNRKMNEPRNKNMRNNMK